ARSGTAAPHAPRIAARFPQRRVQRLRMIRIDDELDRAGLVVLVENLLPRLAAVLRAEDAAIGIRRRVMTERRHVDDVGVAGIDANLRDVLGLGEAGLRPRLPGIGRLVRAVALDDVAADIRSARSDLDAAGMR